MGAQPKGQMSLTALAVLAGLFILIAAGGIWFHRSQKEFVQQRAESELTAITRLKAQDISRWRADKLADTRIITESPFFRESVASWFAHPKTDVTVKIINQLAGIRENYHLVSVLLIDSKGNKRFSSPPAAPFSSDEQHLVVESVMRENRAMFGELFRSPTDGLPRLDVASPLLQPQGMGKAMGVLVLELDPNDTLFPLIQKWPVPSTTAETLLVRRDGDSVLYLNDLRHRSNTALRLRVPLSSIETPAVKVVTGVHGIVSGIDYRGVPVVAELDSIPDSAWHIVAKMDSEEAFGDMRARTVQVIAVTLGLFALTVAAGITWYWRAKRKHLQALRRIEWMLNPKPMGLPAYNPPYGLLTGFNSNRTILDAVGAETLQDIVRDFLDLLGTSTAVYEANGDYAAGIFSSGWCRALDEASFRQAGSDDVRQSLASGAWRCHESCWTQASKEAIATRKPVDIACNGGIRLYAVPICIGDEVIGAINFGYGDPPRDSESLARISRDYGVDVAELRRLADEYEPRPPFIVELARVRLGSAARLIGLLVERRRFEQSLATERERLAVTLRSIGDAVISTDMTGQIVFMNRIAEDLTGWSLIDARGHALADVFKIINEQTRVPCENPVEKVLKTGLVESLANHTVLIARDGTERNIADSGASIRDQSSRIIGVVLVFRDVTLAQKNEVQLLRAQRLESLGLLAGGIAHDFNNLLGGIFGHVEMASYSASRGEAAKANESLSKALAVFDRARNLTQQLLTFSKGGAPRKKPGQLRKTLMDIVSFALSGSNVQCQFDIAPDLWPCEFDESQIGQVIDNIVINAKHAMAHGGFLEVSAKNVEIPSAERPAATISRFVRLSFKDHGTGIPPENMAKIFDPFFSTKQTGSGLGLATSHSIIQQHGGYIEVQSELGKGSTFHVFLPPSSKEVEEFVEAPSVLPTGQGRILVMDDEEFMRDVVAALLGALGYSVSTVREGKEAIAIYQKAVAENQPYDLVILDMTVPGGWGGMETIKELHKTAPAARVILASGYSAHPAMTEPGAYGFSAGIQKPFDQRQLAAVVARVLGAK